MYTFPFSTCEAARETGVAQPWSFAVNAATCVMLVGFLCKARRGAFIVLMALLAFELFHAFSHAMHVPGRLQTAGAHGLAYLGNASMLYAFVEHTGIWPSGAFLAFLAGVVAVDLYAFFHWPMLVYFGTQSLLGVGVLGYYAPRLKMFPLRAIVATVAVILLLFLNETVNCESMLQAYPRIPFHAVIELAGFFLFFLLARAFSAL